MEVVPLQYSHWQAVKTIYEQGLATGIATYEAKCPSWEEWNKSHLEMCRYVAKLYENVLGWVALSPVSSRCIYGGVAETSVKSRVIQCKYFNI